MREFEKKQKFRNRLYSLPALALLLLVTIGMTRGAYNFIVKERESRREALALAAKVETLQKREEILMEESKKLRTEGGIEEEIKSKFNVARAGERVALIVDSEVGEVATTTEELPWWKRTWNAIIGR